jgi:hypothetical protein
MSIEIFDLVIGRKDELPKVPLPPKPKISRVVKYTIPLDLIKEKCGIMGEIEKYDYDKKNGDLLLDVIKKDNVGLFQKR